MSATRTARLAVASLVLVATLAYPAAAQDTAAPAIVPRPQVMTVGKGRFVVTPAAVIVAGDSSLRPVARQLATHVRAAAGFTPRAAQRDRRTRGAIRLALDSTLAPEGYRLEVTPSGVRITGGSAAGVFHGVQSLRQLMPVRHAGGTVRIAAVRIEDAPRFAWRGMHLDVSRHFFPPAYLKRFVDYLALYKFNRLHLHLTDDQGWRLEIPRYPKLVQEGAWRTPNDHDREVLRRGEENPDFFHLPAEHFRGEGDARRYGGYYTREDIRELVAYAAARHVTIVPEVDMPGHFMAAIAQYPALSCTGAAAWGRTFSVPLCPGKEEVYTFVGHVLDEVTALFPGPWVHIGGDEVEKTTWTEHAGSRALMAREGLADVDALQGYFIRRVARMLADRGRRMIGWDEILDDRLPRDATIMYWRGWVPGVAEAAARRGNDVIMSPTSCCYFDYDETAETLSSLYRFEPVPATLGPAESRRILGVQANLWSEYIATPAQVEFMAFPRTLALAEVAWTDTAARDWDDFARRLRAHYPRLDAMGLRYRVPPVAGLHPRTVVVRDTTIRLATPAAGVRLRYTTDGSVPTRSSRAGTVPLRVTRDVTLRVRPYYPDGTAGATQTVRIERQVPRTADVPAALQPGLTLAFHRIGVTSVDSIGGDPERTMVVPDVTVPADVRADAFALVYGGWLRVPMDGVYTFTLVSDDGSTLHVGDRLVIDNDGAHGPRAIAGQVALRAGLHPIRVGFFEGGGGHTLGLRWEGPGVAAGPVPATAFSTGSGRAPR